jgi:hypothetical protein
MIATRLAKAKKGHRHRSSGKGNLGSHAGAIAGCGSSILGLVPRHFEIH